MTGNGRRHTSSQLDVTTLISSVIAGVVGFLISGIIYMLVKEILWSPLAVGLSFMIFAVVFIVIMVVISMMNDNLGYHVSKHHDGGQIFLALLVIVILSLVLGTLFEFLYEIDLYSKQDIYQEPTSYVFIIDNSGSMDSNDPEGRRYSAIKQIISEKDDDFPYAVYSFSDSVMVDRELAPISAGNNDLQPQVMGGTMLRLALTTVYDEYESHMSDQLGDAPKFLLLSDGYATDIGWFSSIDKVLKSYAKTNITISTVGLGDADDQLMQQIADGTGGVYISVDDVSQLEDSMEQAIKQNGEDKYSRTLYTHRTVPKLDFVYALMRIVFTAVLGIMISCSMLFATGKGEDSQMIIGSSIVTGILAGLILELGINLLNISPILIRGLYFILVAVTFVTLKAFGGKGSAKSYQDNQELYTGRGRLDMGGSSSIGNDNGFGSSDPGQYEDSFFDF